MTVVAPKIDERTAAELRRDMARLLPSWYASEPRELTEEGRFEGLDGALTQVVARYAELIINRLNRAPEKSFLAFLQLLGVSPLPMEAARVPLTFYLAPGAESAMVPAGTQVAAPPPVGERKPLLFETERALFVSPVKLDLLRTKSGQTDQFVNLDATLSDPESPASPRVALPTISVKAEPIPHILYIALPVQAAQAKFDRLTLKFVIESPVTPSHLTQPTHIRDKARDKGRPPIAPLPSLQWEVQAIETAKSVEVTASNDGTRSLAETGQIVFQDLPTMAPTTIGGLAGLWVGCRLRTPLLRETGLARIADLSVAVEQTRKDLRIELGFCNSAKLDLSKDAYPFGERPKLGDTCYFAQREAFSNPDAKVTLRLKLISLGAGDAGPALRASPAQLIWEFWNGREWEGMAPESAFEDGTHSLGMSGDVSFRFSSSPVELSVNGFKNYWVRVRITGGDYGKDAQAQQDPATGKVVLIQSSFAPPVIHSLMVDYEVKKESKPAAVVAYNDFEFKPVDVRTGFWPFAALTPEQAPPALYFGFTLQAPPAGSKETAAGTFPDGPVTAYVVLADVAARDSEMARAANAVATWEYWGSSGWECFPAPDETQGLRKSGLMHFVVPKDFTMRSEFGVSRYWLRMRLDPTEFVPNIISVHLNTVLAEQSATIVNDVLGSSNGKPDQKFLTTQPMVLPGQKLEVREPTMPPAEERARVARDEGSQAIQRVIDPLTGKWQFWVTWHQVPNFDISEARDRHYVLDHVTGEVTFGDGDSGMVPPVLGTNIRMARYRSGGGAKGNLPPNSIKQLVSAVPYIQKVTNWLAASGGTDPETNESLMERGPRGVRHRGRAVTVEDYEDLAMLASREVARAKCVPGSNLQTDPDARSRKSGVISLILLPHSTHPKPMPSSALFDRVMNFLDARRMAALELVLVGPEYVRVDISVEIAVALPELVGQVEIDVTRELEKYLHPVTGGPRGTGWEFGRLPHRFDLCVLIERIAGVSNVRELGVRVIADRPGAERTGRQLIFSGQHDVTVRLEEQFAANLTQSR